MFRPAMRNGALGGACAVVDAAPDKDDELRRDTAAFLARSRQLLELVDLAAQGPDPDALLPDVVELAYTCAAFLRSHPHP